MKINFKLINNNRMENSNSYSYSLKYSDSFQNLLKHESTLQLPLSIYLKINSIIPNDQNLISFITQTKNYCKNKEKNIKVKDEFLECFSQLIENVIGNFKLEDLNFKILDNFGIAQLSLCAIATQWIKAKDNAASAEKEIAEVLEVIHNFIIREYGADYLELFDIMGLYKKEKVSKISSINEAIINAKILIKNIHPNEFNSSISEFILKNYEEYKNYKIDVEKISPFKKQEFQKIFKHIKNIFSIIIRMEKYNEKSRLNFFNEFKGQDEFLSTINFLLSKMKKEKIYNLDNIYDDINLVIENNQHLLKKNEELNKKLNTKIQEAEDMEFKAKQFQTQLSKLKSELNECQKINTDISKELFDTNVLLNKEKNKLSNHLHRDICGKIENYFYYIISPNGREEIDKALENKEDSKINLYYNRISTEYPHLFGKIKKGGINWYNFLCKINIFRKENNMECHDISKVNYETLVKTLNYYFDNSFNFEKSLNYMINNFEEFREYIFVDKYELNANLCDVFKKMEGDIISNKK